ncbi:hypothetical protein GCM10023231_18450 [Olivibacter ginsenosidimutans]|uniref:Uncharacterized protein n=1 Tax=Olivibacter ginsenosidimutans TaxID=1176537 RepID=A0ABP9B5D5_9SPHI
MKTLKKVIAKIKKEVKEVNGYAAVGFIAMSLFLFAFKTEPLTREANNARAEQTWFFNGNDLSQAKTESAYQATPTGQCNGIEEVPCEISFEANDYMTPATNTPLKNYLDAHPTVNDVLDDAQEVRSAQ